MKDRARKKGEEEEEGEEVKMLYRPFAPTFATTARALYPPPSHFNMGPCH